MFGDLMGGMQQKQAALQQKLVSMQVEAESNGIRVVCNGVGNVIDVALDPAKLDFTDVEMIEDLLITVLNQALDKSSHLQETETSSLMKDLLPPGFGGF
jgi:nucleoid-associated protein EbfC